MLQTAFRPSCMNRVSVFEWHKRFKEGRESVRDDEKCGKSKEVNRPELIGQRVRVMVRVTMLRTMHQFTTPSLSQTIWPRWASRQFLSVSIVETLLPVTFSYSLSTEIVILRQLRRWKRLWRRSLTRSHKRISIGPCRSCWNGTISALHPEENTSKGTWVSYEYYQ